MTKCKVIALANQKGGTAKTTTTLNLELVLHIRGEKYYWSMLIHREINNCIRLDRCKQSSYYVGNTNEERCTRRTICV